MLQRLEPASLARCCAENTRERHLLPDRRSGTGAYGCEWHAAKSTGNNHKYKWCMCQGMCPPPNPPTPPPSFPPSPPAPPFAPCDIIFATIYNPNKQWSGFNLTLGGVVEELPADGSTNFINRQFCNMEGCQKFSLSEGTPESLSYTVSDVAEVH